MTGDDDGGAGDAASCGRPSNWLIEEIERHPLAGNDYFSCIQCGRCVGSCPAAKISNRFNMRLINRRIMDGDASLLEDEVIWDCFYCQSCVNLCPRDNIDGYKTIIILRDLALKRGHGTGHMKNIVPLMDQFLEKGVLTDGPSWLSRESIDEIAAISRLAGLPEKIGRLKKGLERGGGR